MPLPICAPVTHTLRMADGDQMHSVRILQLALTDCSGGKGAPSQRVRKRGIVLAASAFEFVYRQCVNMSEGQGGNSAVLPI